MKKHKVINRNELVPAHVLYNMCWDVLTTEDTKLPVDIFVDVASNISDGIYGIWYRISAMENLKVYYCSFIDVDGNFYCDKEQTFLSEKVLLKIRNFVRRYKKEIIEVSEQDLSFKDFVKIIKKDLVTFGGIDIYSLKYKES